MRNRATWVMVFALTAKCIAGQKEMIPTPTPVETEVQSAMRGLSAQQYERFRVSALAGAQRKVVSNLKNSSLSQNGVDQKLMATLEEQRAYLVQLHNDAGNLPLTTPKQKLMQSASLKATPSTNSAPSKTALKTTVFDALNCKRPQIRSVNGKKRDAIFTPQLPDNVYHIEGCMFGRVPGQIQLEPHPVSREQTALPIRLQLKPVANSWSEHEIDAYLDDHLAGVFDAPVTLVIFPGKGRRLELPGCFFVARRGEPKLLGTIPASWVKLQATTTAVRGIKQLEYVSPPQRGAGVPSYASGTSALTLRSDSIPFEAGVDVFDLSKLNPGWKVESMQLQRYVVSCPGDVTRAENFGKWNATWIEDGFTVGWATQSCAAYVSPTFNFDLSTSLYALKVWVVGPVGTEPLRTN